MVTVNSYRMISCSFLTCPVCLSINSVTRDGKLKACKYYRQGFLHYASFVDTI